MSTTSSTGETLCPDHQHAYEETNCFNNYYTEICRFSVSSIGVISTTATLDREERAVYHLTLVARDGGGTTMNPGQANTLIVIEVIDTNDHTPQCFPLSTTVTLIENTAFPNFLTISVRALYAVTSLDDHVTVHK
jgi:hypothetical protein